MTGKEREQLEAFLTESFSDGVIARELRLSPDEKAYLKDRFPRAHLMKMAGLEPDDGKEWYEVRLTRQ